MNYDICRSPIINKNLKVILLSLVFIKENNAFEKLDGIVSISVGFLYLVFTLVKNVIPYSRISCKKYVGIEILKGSIIKEYKFYKIFTHI